MKFKGIYKRKNAGRTPPDNDFLKYWRVIRHWVKAKYGLNTSDLEMLLFLYSEQIFNKTKFKEYEQLMSWDQVRFSSLLKNKWIHVWRKKQGSETTLYELTYKGKKAINTIYKKLNGEELSEIYVNNPLFRKDASYMDKVHRNMILKMNEEIKNPSD
tara:strand:- start:3965 stop:4435 length:471 start_codon:yes stop_codon:yes gene_type:complete